MSQSLPDVSDCADWRAIPYTLHRPRPQTYPLHPPQQLYDSMRKEAVATTVTRHSGYRGSVPVCTSTRPTEGSSTSPLHYGLHKKTPPSQPRVRSSRPLVRFRVGATLLIKPLSGRQVPIQSTPGATPMASPTSLSSSSYWYLCGYIS